MAPFQHTRFALFKRQKATKNKEKIVISDNEVEEVIEAPKGWGTGYDISNYMGSYYREPSPDPSKTYCDMCTKEIEAGILQNVQLNRVL